LCDSSLLATYMSSQQNMIGLAGAISEGVNELVLYLDDGWSHLLGYDKDGVMSPPQSASYAEAFHAASTPLKSICGFRDCMGHTAILGWNLTN
jgi:hypothetical protein